MLGVIRRITQQVEIGAETRRRVPQQVMVVRMLVDHPALCGDPLAPERQLGRLDLAPR
jgi:hypothetical protein